MLRTLRLTAALLAGLCLPALAQTPAVRPSAPAVMPVPAPRSPVVAAPSPAAASKRIDVNSASETELAALPGIGPVTAKNIVAGRPWDDLGALVTKKAVNQPTFARNKDRLALANVNTSSAADMAKTLPGIGEVRAKKIVDGRPYATPAELVSKNVLTSAQYEKIKDLVTY